MDSKHKRKPSSFVNPKPEHHHHYRKIQGELICRCGAKPRPKVDRKVHRNTVYVEKSRLQKKRPKGKRVH